MKILVIGASGTIGSAVVKELGSRHEIIKVGKTKGDFTCDLRESNTVKQMFQKVGAFDALISAVGSAHFAPFEEMTEELFYKGLKDKLMGQVNLVLIGRDFIKEKGSFTLTSGILAYDPIRCASSISMVNGALDAFVRATAIELPKGTRINTVCPTLLTESFPKLGAFFRGFETVPASRVALAYSKSVEGLQTGQVYKVT